MNISFFNCASARAQRQFFLGSSFILAIVLLAVPATADGQVSETPNRWIRGVAKVTLDRNGKSQISFNPQRCRELGPDLCEFFRTHEYGHVNMRHLERGVAAPQAELEADLWAARNASPSAVRAAKEFFLSGKGGSRIHGTPQERARRMDAGAASVKRSSTPAGASVQTSATQGKRRLPKTAPKSYSATSKQRVRYRVGHATSRPNGSQVTVQRIPVTQPAQQTASRKLAQTAPKTAAKTVRHIVLSPPKVSQPSRRNSSGYVPRGDFLNPR